MNLQTTHEPSAVMMSVDEVAALLPGSRLVVDGQTPTQTLSPTAQKPILRVHTDSRTVQAGDLFVALRGEHFDAHDFLCDVRARGAVAVLAEHGIEAAGLPGVQVPDTRVALGALAAAWRKRWSLPVIAVTGSNGKTTVTQMLASVLQAHWPQMSLATQGNLNNDIGVPLTLLRLRAHHRAAVVELGMNHPGEIAQLARWTQPTVALVNNAQREHQEFMGSVQAVAQENAQVFGALPPQGVAVFGADDEYAPLWSGMSAGVRQWCFSTHPELPAAVQLKQAQWLQGRWQVRVLTEQGVLNYDLRVPGAHNVRNSLAVVACALACGVSLSSIQQGLEQFVPVKGRSRCVQLVWSDHSGNSGNSVNGGGSKEISLVDDTYNANPDSVRAAIEVLRTLPAPRVLVLGDMGEVGVQGPQFHTEVGAYAQACGIEHVFTLGELASFSSQAFAQSTESTQSTQAQCASSAHFKDVDGLVGFLGAHLGAYGSVLVKGSRFMRMERVVQALEKMAAQGVLTPRGESCS